MLAAVSLLMSGTSSDTMSAPWTVPMTWRQRALTPAAEQEPIELDAFVAQRIALVDADDRRDESRHIVFGRE